MPSAAGLIMPSKSRPRSPGARDEKSRFPPKLGFTEPQAAQPDLLVAEFADRTGRLLNFADLRRRDGYQGGWLKENERRSAGMINKRSETWLSWASTTGRPASRRKGRELAMGGSGPK